MQFQEMEYPRRKNFIRNLNILLDSNLVPAPDKQLSARFCSPNPILQRRHSNFPNSETHDLTHPIKLQGVSNARTVHSSRNFEAERRMVQTAQGSRREKMKSMLSMENMRRHLMSSRKLSINQKHARAKEHRDSIKHPEYDIRMVSSSAQLTRDWHQPPLGAYRSVESRRNKEELYDYRPREILSQKKEFLRKGSSINKSILNNIVRLKLSRVAQQDQGMEEYIDNQQIVNMIKLYKGSSVGMSRQHRGKTAEQRPPDRCPMSVDRWDHFTEQFDPIAQTDPIPDQLNVAS